TARRPGPVLDRGADGGSVAVEQDRDDEKPPATRDDRTPDKQPDVVPGKARGDGHELVGDRRQTFANDDQGAPLGIGSTEGFDLVAQAIEIDQPLPERVIEQGADRVAEQASGSGSDRAPGREQPGVAAKR